MLSSYAIILIPNQMAGGSTKFTSEVSISEIPVGKTPRGIAINPDNNRIYVVNERSNTISVIDGNTNEVINTIPVGEFSVGKSLTGIAINPDNNRIYVVNERSNTTSVIDGNTNEVINTIPVGEIATGVAVNSKTNRTYVTNFGSNTTSVIDGNTNEVINTIPVGESPGSIAVDPDDNRIYVASHSSDMISIIDGNTNEVLPTNITLDYSIGSIYANPHTNKLYISCNDLGNRLCIIDTQTNRTAIVYSGAYSVAINPDTNTIYAVNRDANTVSIIDGNTNSISKTIPVGESPGSIAVDPDDNRIYVVNPLFDTISVIDGKTILAASENIIADQYYIPGIKVGENPSKIAIDRDNNRIYVVNTGSDSVSIIDGSNDKVVDNIQVGRRPVDIAINPDNNRIYVVNERSNTISVIDGNTNRLLPINISVGNPRYIAVDWTSDRIYVINDEINEAYYDRVISVIDSNTNEVINKIFVGKTASGIAVDPITDVLYVTISDSNSVYVIDARTNRPINTIHVGERPLDINITEQTQMIYVTNPDSDSVSVIDLEKKSYEMLQEYSPMGKVVDNVTVGRRPVDIAINPDNNRIYVRNGGSNTISVIDGNTNRLLPINISVGQPLVDIAVNQDNNTIYLANSLSDSVSIMDGNTNDLVTGATFDVKPDDSGYIICDSKDIPTNNYIRIKFRTQCKAVASNGFAFNSWIESLGSNSSRTITKSSTAGSILNSFFPNPNDDNRTTFAVTSFGNFVANFREAPPPIPKEIWISLFGISLSVILPSLLRWYNGWKQRRRFYEYIEELPSKKKTFNLETINNDITQLYAKGKINESQHKMLKEKASEFYSNVNK